MHAREKGHRSVHDTLAFLLVNVERPVVTLRYMAKYDSVASRHHPARRVGDIRLRHERDQLPLDWRQLLVAEQGLRAEPGTVDDHGFGQRREIAWGIERTDHDLPTERDHIVHQRVEIDRRF